MKDSNKIPDEELSQSAGGSGDGYEIVGYAVVCGKCRQRIEIYPTMAEADQHAWTYCPTCGREAMVQGYSNWIEQVKKWN